MKKKQDKKMIFSIKFIGYIVEIDAYDYDYLIFFQKEIKKEEYYKNKVLETIKNYKNKIKKYGTEIDFAVYELYKVEPSLKDFECSNFFDSFPYEDINEIVIENELNENISDPKRFLTKKIISKKLKMPLTDINKRDYYDNKISEIASQIYIYNGANLLFNKEVLNELKQLITEIENFELKN